VILPCFNVSACITRAIDSLLRQDFPDFEVILVDDGSTDKTAEVARRAIAGDPRFRIVTQPNLGLSCARNVGMDLARGRYLAFLDGDDHFADSFLSTMVNALERSGAAWSACAIWLDYPDGTRIPHSAIHGAPDPTGNDRWLDLTNACSVARVFPSAWNKLYRREFVAAHRFNPGAIYEDHPFFWALACESDAIWYVPRPLYHHHRGRPMQITAQADSVIFQQFDRLDEVRQILATGRKQDTTKALSQLATRLVHERLEPVADTALRTAFVARADQYFQTHGLQWDWAGAADISLSHVPMLDPALRLGVVVLDGDGKQDTLNALARQRLPVWQVSHAPAGPSWTAVQDALSTLETPWVALLRAGDIPHPDWAAAMVHALRSTPTARLAVCATLRDPGEIYDAGLALTDPLLPCADPSALVLKRGTVLPDPTGLPDWTALIQMADRTVLARSTKQNPPLATLARATPPSARSTLRGLRKVIAQGHLRPEHAMAVYAHKAQLAVLARHGRAARLATAVQWGILRRLARLPPGPVGAHIGPRLHRLL
jgi:hypothetical protein